MDPNEKDYVEIDLGEVFHILVDNARNICIVTVCCVLMAGTYLMITPPTPPQPAEAPWPVFYRSQTTLRVKVVSNAANFNVAQKMATYAQMLSSGDFVQPVREKLEITHPVGSAGGSPVKDTELLTIYFDADTPETAQKGSKLLTQAFMDYIARKEQFETQYALNASTGEPSVLFQRVECEIVSSASLPSSPIPKPKPKEDPKNPKPKPTDPATTRNRTLAVSALLGVLLGSGYAVMHALMNRKITTEKDVEDYLGLPVLGVIPDEASLQEALERQGKRSIWQKIGNMLWKQQDR